MKTLDQLDAKLTTIDSKTEKRTPIDATHTPGDANNMFIISQPGSYYLPANLSATKPGAIYVTAANVTVDLNGFAITGGGGGLAIDIALAANGCRIMNGSVGTGFSVAVASEHSGLNYNHGGLVQNLTILSGGISVGSEWVIDRCTVVSGQIMVVSGCIVQNCAVTNPGKTAFAFLGDASSAFNCAAYGASVGFDVEISARLWHCTADYCDTGYFVNGNSRLEQNMCFHSSTVGYDIFGSENYIDGNVSINNALGFRTSSAGGNLIIRNSSKGGNNGFPLGSGDSVGPVVNVWNNGAGGTIMTTSPWANFAY